MSATTITLADITSADWSLRLDIPGQPGSGIGKVVQGTTDVSQCIQIILTTPKGSDPLRPTFGTDLWQFIDYPLQTAIPLIVREVTEAITLWEPRVQLVKVVATPVIDGSQQSGAHMAVTVKWRLKLGNRSQTAAPFAAAVQDTTVAIGRASVINSAA